MKKITLNFITLLFVIFDVTTASSQCWKEIETGYTTSLALKNDGTLWKWGAGTNTPIQLGTDSNWKTISQGSGHGSQITVQSLAIKTNGTLWAWGSNNYGQCGNGVFGGSLVNPMQIGTATDWDSVSTGKYHSMAIKTDGTLWAWGFNSSGQLGDGSTTNKNVPVQIGTSTNWKSVSACNNFTLAIKTDGTLWSWGSNNYERLGLNLGPSSFYYIITSPMQVGTDTNWNSIVSGSSFGYHGAAIKTDGTLWAWGLNSSGQLGDGTTISRSTPTRIGTDNDWNFVSFGEEYTYAIKTNGTLWGWGYNGSGGNSLLGDGTNIERNIPTQIGVATTWKKVNSELHTLALRTDNSLWVWGINSAGELGNGNSQNQSTPVPVACPSSLEITNFVAKQVSIFPNPTTGIVTISNQDNLTIDKIEILDILGKTVSVKTDNTSQVDISHLSNGIYIFKIYSGETVFQKKIIKQ